VRPRELVCVLTLCLEETLYTDDNYSIFSVDECTTIRSGAFIGGLQMVFRGTGRGGAASAASAGFTSTSTSATIPTLGWDA
jgi:hypothetical protein